MIRLLDSRIGYTAMLRLLLPYAWFHLWWRARKQPEYLQNVDERFGHYTVNTDKPVIWLHAVSVGETRAAVTLVRGLRARYPDFQILMTHTTPTGRATSEQLFGDDVMRIYLPYDFPDAVQRFLDHFRPCIGILLETEIWFNLVRACRNASIPLLLLNARLSDKSARRYARFPRLAHAGFHDLYLIAAQSEDDALRFASLGNHATPVMGNLKFDIVPPPEMLDLGKQLRERFGQGRAVLLIASTREGEEELVLKAIHNAQIDRLLVVMVPRHPQRFDEVAALIEKHGMHMQRRSANEPIAPQTQVVLGDSMGEMFAYYAACDIAFVGGSLIAYGGQNLIECCAVGKPVLIGPHAYNFAQATEMAVACGAAMQVAHVDDLVLQLNILLHDRPRLEQMGAAGLRFVNDNRGATEHALQLVELALNQSPQREIASSQVKSAP